MINAVDSNDGDISGSKKSQPIRYDATTTIDGGDYTIKIKARSASTSTALNKIKQQQPLGRTQTSCGLELTSVSRTITTTSSSTSAETVKVQQDAKKKRLTGTPLGILAEHEEGDDDFCSDSVADTDERCSVSSEEEIFSVHLDNPNVPRDWLDEGKSEICLSQRGGVTPVDNIEGMDSVDHECMSESKREDVSSVASTQSESQSPPQNEDSLNIDFGKISKTISASPSGRQQNSGSRGRRGSLFQATFHGLKNLWGDHSSKNSSLHTLDPSRTSGFENCSPNGVKSSARRHSVATPQDCDSAIEQLADFLEHRKKFAAIATQLCPQVLTAAIRSNASPKQVNPSGPLLDESNVTGAGKRTFIPRPAPSRSPYRRASCALIQQQQISNGNVHMPIHQPLPYGSATEMMGAIPSSSHNTTTVCNSGRALARRRFSNDSALRRSGFCQGRLDTATQTFVNLQDDKSIQTMVTRLERVDRGSQTSEFENIVSRGSMTDEGFPDSPATTINNT